MDRRGGQLSALTDDDRKWLDVAIAQARAGHAEGGIPIGAALVADGVLLGAGHNRRVQSGSAAYSYRTPSPQAAAVGVSSPAAA